MVILVLKKILRIRTSFPLKSVAVETKVHNHDICPGKGHPVWSIDLATMFSFVFTFSIYSVRGAGGGPPAPEVPFCQREPGAELFRRKRFKQQTPSGTSEDNF